MMSARDPDGLTQQCDLNVAQIREDGELLAWNGIYGCSHYFFMGEYCFRAGLDENTKLLLLAMFASMIP